MRGGHKRRIACARCGRVISARAHTNECVAHKCPHGQACVLPRWGEHPRPALACPQCVADAPTIPAPEAAQ